MTDHMCGRFTSTLSRELLAATFDVAVPTAPEPRYNIAPAQQVPVVRCSDEGGNRLDWMTWGLVPPWATDTSGDGRRITARCETIQEQSASRQALACRRCIIPASGFYEWHQAENGSQPYYIHAVDRSPMGFAGVWETWETPEGETVESFRILTTVANKLVKPIHDRMPVIVPPADYPFWLDRDMQDTEQLRRLYSPYPAELLQAYMVPDLVNNPRFDSQTCIVQV